jgi:hypothetical protein
MTRNPDISYEFDLDCTTLFHMLRAMLAHKPSISWCMPVFIACISTEDSVGMVYPIFASLVTHAKTTYFYAIVCWGAFIPNSEIYTTPVPLLAQMEKLIRHWIYGPLSTWKVWTSTTSTPKYESVSLSQMIGLITYGTFIYIYIYTYQKIYLYKRIWHINLLETYRVPYYAWMIKRYFQQHWIVSPPWYVVTETYDFWRRKTTSSHLFSQKSIYQKSYQHMTIHKCISEVIDIQ